MNSLLTIAIPVHNRTTYFRQALESALHQTAPSPVLVVDNASDQVDFARLIAEYARPGLRFVRNETNLGMAGNWNQCIRLCQTPYLLLLHDDDYLEPGYVDFFLRHHEPAALLYWCRTGIVDAEGKVVRAEAVPNFEQYAEPINWCFGNPGYAGIIFDAQKAAALGGFSRTLKLTPDWELWMRLVLAGPARFLETQGAWYRDYWTLERTTCQLQGSDRFFFYWRNQVKRNVQRFRPKLRYKDFLRGGRLPALSVTSLESSLPDLAPWKLDYFVKLCVLSKPATFGGKLMRLVLGVLGWRCIYWLRPLLKMRARSSTKA